MKRNPPETKLHQAILDGDLASFHGEIDSGSNIDTPDGKGRISLLFAVKNGSTEIVKNVVAYICSQDHLCEGAFSCFTEDQSDLLQIILSKWTTFDTPDLKTGTLPIFQAIENDAKKCIQLLTPLVNLKAVNQNGLSIEEYAIEINRPQYANLLKKMAEDEADELVKSLNMAPVNSEGSSEKRRL